MKASHILSLLVITSLTAACTKFQTTDEDSSNTVFKKSGVGTRPVPTPISTPAPEPTPQASPTPGTSPTPKPSPTPPGTLPPPAMLLKNPFNMWSAHHRPIGAFAEAGVPGGTENPRAKSPTYDAPGAINSRGRLNVVGTFRVGHEKKQMLLVHPSDPFQVILPTPGKIGSNLPTPAPGLRFPASADLPDDGDAIVGLFPRNGLAGGLLDVFFQFRADGFTASKRASYPLHITDVYEDQAIDRSPGASAIRIPSGVLLGDEINAAKPQAIYHALNATATRHSLKGAPGSLHVLSQKMVWPAYDIDRLNITQAEDPENYDNQGDLPYGTVIFIRPQDYAKRETLGLTDRQKVLFDIFAYYGCRLVDGQGQVENNKAVLQLRTDGELNAAALAETNELLKKVLPLLYPLRNPRKHSAETETFTNGLPYAGGGGPRSTSKSINNAWDAPH